MPRVKRGVTARARHKKILAQAKGFDKKNGARPLKRAIQKYIEDLLAEEIVNNNIKEGDNLEICHKKGEDILHVKIHSNKKSK